VCDIFKVCVICGLPATLARRRTSDREFLFYTCDRHGEDVIRVHRDTLVITAEHTERSLRAQAMDDALDEWKKRPWWYRFLTKKEPPLPPLPECKSRDLPELRRDIAALDKYVS
jgi:hypothetical protein